MLANKRIVKENGFVNIPNTSIGAKITFIKGGTPGIQKICPQYSLFALNCTIKNVNKAKQSVTAILPVTLNPSGVKPSKFKIQIYCSDP